MKPREYQQRAIDQLYAWMRENAGKNPCLEMPTGSGKSHIVALLCRDAVTNWPETKILMLTHVKELIEQNAEKMKQYWPNAPLGIYSASVGKRRIGEPITFGGIQSLRKKAKQIGHIDLIIIDECHLVSHKNEGGYRKLINDLIEINPSLVVIGLTATPYRLGHGYITDDPAIFDDIIKPVTIEELVEAGYLAELISKKTTFSINVDSVKKRGGEFIESDLQNSVDTEINNATIIEETLERSEGREHWLVFCTGVAHAKKMCDLLNDRGVPSASLTGENTKAEREQIIKDFKSGKYRALTNANILTTGFDYPEIDLIIMARPTLSPALYCLSEDTEILTTEGFKRKEQINRNTIVASVNKDNFEISYDKHIGYISRQLDKDEFFISVKNQYTDILVTNKHDMIIKKRRFDRTLTDIQTVKAESLMDKSEFYIPASINQNRQDADISDCELRLLGLVITDGSINKHNNAISISQSSRYPEVIDYIEDTLLKCGVKFTKSVARKKGEETNFGISKHALYRWTISKGKPRGRDKHKIGWNALPWISKNLSKSIPDNLKTKLSKRQCGIFLESMHMGDGIKSFKSGFKICCATQKMANDIQELAINCGYQANILTNGKDSKMLLVSIFDVENRAIFQGSKDRSKAVKVSRHRGASWCVETKNGTLITRRNGKMAIIGNCQMAGRGMRLKEGPNKDCFVFDFAQNIFRHGPITDVVPRKPGPKQDAPVKPCPECDSLLPISAKKCKHCGYEFPPGESHQSEVSMADDCIMGRSESRLDIYVDWWDWSVHTSRTSGKEMIKCSYYPDDLSGPVIREYLCITHEGFAGQKALAELAKITNSTGAMDVYKADDLQQVCDILNQADAPTKVEYEKNGKFYNVKRRIWEEASDIDFEPATTTKGEEESWLDTEPPF